MPQARTAIACQPLAQPQAATTGKLQAGIREPSADEISMRSAVSSGQSGPTETGKSVHYADIAGIESVSEPDAFTIICARWKSCEA
ncbi:hypothetical protein [Mesorhizobium sp. M1027]|uniref:hypothetical protein n=1 Tax=Mesorhizobium sp. M1027 TaxID=2957050 RepID=UPI00333B1941